MINFITKILRVTSLKFRIFSFRIFGKITVGLNSPFWTIWNLFNPQNIANLHANIGRIARTSFMISLHKPVKSTQTPLKQEYVTSSMVTKNPAFNNVLMMTRFHGHEESKTNLWTLDHETIRWMDPTNGFLFSNFNSNIKYYIFAIYTFSINRSYIHQKLLRIILGKPRIETISLFEKS